MSHKCLPVPVVLWKLECCLQLCQRAPEWQEGKEKYIPFVPLASVRAGLEQRVLRLLSPKHLQFSCWMGYRKEQWWKREWRDVVVKSKQSTGNASNRVLYIWCLTCHYVTLAFITGSFCVLLLIFKSIEYILSVYKSGVRNFCYLEKSIWSILHKNMLHTNI